MAAFHLIVQARQKSKRIREVHSSFRRERIQRNEDISDIRRALQSTSASDFAYLAKDNGVLCPKCANEFTPDRDNDEQLEPVAYGINYEDSALYCEHCNGRIESAYGEDEVQS